MKLYKILSNTSTHARTRTHVHARAHTRIWFNGKGFSYDL